MSEKHMNIDLVYLWVDGNDPEWLEKKQRFMEKEINTVGRYVDNQELKYSMRSIEKHLPWIRKIFIVTDNQTPAFLNTSNPKIQLVDLTEIMPNAILPSFNSNVIEQFFYNIPDLSEHFLYANDDMFVNTDLKPSFFFKGGLPIMRMMYDPFTPYKNNIKRAINIKINPYRMAIENAYKLFYKKFKVMYPVKDHHNINAYLKSDYKAVVENVFKDELEATHINRFREKTDIQRILINYYGIANKTGILRYVKRKESSRIKVHKTNYQAFLDKHNPQLFCLNDSEHATDDHRAQIEPFLKKLFSVKSQFEK